MNDLLYREFVPDLEIRSAAKGGDGRTVDGIVVPFGVSQRINAQLTERFARGAFNHQIAAAHRVKFAREHMALGGTLIGRALEMRDDASGLWVAHRVSATERGDETLALIADGALDELSVGFREARGGNRRLADGTIERVKAHLFEVAVVVEGAYGRGARIKALRSAEGLPEELDEEAAESDEARAEAPSRERLARARALLAGLPPV